MLILFDKVSGQKVSRTKLVEADVILQVSDGRGITTLKNALLDSFNNLKEVMLAREIKGNILGKYTIHATAVIDPQKALPLQRALRRFSTDKSVATFLKAKVNVVIE